jgi:unsaturated rhamnogalacturonyl hydrolase
MRMLLPLLLISITATAQQGSNPAVLLDGYHNAETKAPLHYRWEGTGNGGFSQLGDLLKELGAQLRTTTTALTPDSLAGVRCLIIVDPDTPAESGSPHYVSDTEVKAVADWVNNGGRLVLLGNDKGNAEFEHFNRLAKQFGIEFVEDTIPRVTGKAILEAEGQGPIFEGAPRFYGVELAPLRLLRNNGADVLLSYEGTPVMVLVQHGRGLAFALGDPWIYNEYINRDDNREIARKLFAMLLRY